LTIRKVRKSRVRKGRGRPPAKGGRDGSGHLNSSGGLDKLPPSLFKSVYAMEKLDAVLCHDFPRVVLEKPEEKEWLLIKMKETKWVLNEVVLKTISSDRELADKVDKEGIPKDLYNELFSTLISYGTPDWIAEGALRGAVTIVRQWRRTLRKGERAKVRTLRVYVKKEWYHPETGYLEFPEGPKFRVVGGNPKCKSYPIVSEWVMVVYNPNYDAVYLDLVKEKPPKERKLNTPLSYILKQALKRGYILAVDHNVMYTVAGNGRKELERRYPTLYTAINELGPDRSSSVLCYGSSSKVCDTLEKLRDRFSRLYNTLVKLLAKYPGDKPRGVRRRIGLIRREMSVIDRQYTRAIAKDIVNYAMALGSSMEGLPAVIVLEDLRGLNVRIKEDSSKPKAVKEKVSTMAYSKLDKQIIALAKIYGVPYVFVDPAGTSTTCPICGAKLVEVGYRRLRCPAGHFEEDRDTIAIMNLVKRAKSLLSSSL
jgi:IS605 OrfB family transposase